MRMLIVEDEMDLREVLAETFRMMGCLVLEANHGKEALEILAQEAVDLILTDVQMPIMDGMTFLKECKAKFRSKIVFVMTGFSHHSKAEFTAQGADGFFEKPLNITKVYQEGLDKIGI